jgi:hypothetical protein
MTALKEEGVPYNDAIESLIWDFEFHYRVWNNQGKPDMFSSMEAATNFCHLDVKLHSEVLGLNYEIGKRIFHYWAGTFHRKKYKGLIDEFDEIEGISWEPAKILHELRELLKNLNENSFTFH